MGGMRIFAVLALAAAFAAGCTHERIVNDSKNPEVEYTENGDLKWRGEFIDPEDLPDLLEDAEVGKKSQINIRVPPTIRSLKGPRLLLFMLRRAGYTRAVLVTEKKAYSKGMDPAELRKPVPQQPARRTIRYK